MNIATGFILVTVIFGWFSNVSSICQTRCSNRSTSESKAVGRHDARIEEAPFFVSVADEQKNGSLGIFCAGSYISALWVVTAANCLNENTDIKLPPNPGKHDRLTLIMELDVFSQIDTKQKRKSSQLIIHPNFVSLIQKKSMKKDIALIKLLSPFSISEKAKTAVLPGRYINYANAEINVVGWVGKETPDNIKYITPGNLQILKLIVMTNYDCLPFKYNKEIFCAAQKSGKSGCHGGGGGPAVYKGMVIGVLSFVASADGTCNTAYVVYESMYNHLKWMREYVSDITSISRNNKLGRSVLWLCCIKLLYL